MPQCIACLLTLALQCQYVWTRSIMHSPKVFKTFYYEAMQIWLNDTVTAKLSKVWMQCIVIYSCRFVFSFVYSWVCVKRYREQKGTKSIRNTQEHYMYPVSQFQAGWSCEHLEFELAVECFWNIHVKWAWQASYAPDTFIHMLSQAPRFSAIYFSVFSLTI